MTAYDAVVIGSGTAGQTAAYSLKAGGLSVAVEKRGRSCRKFRNEDTVPLNFQFL